MISRIKAYLRNRRRDWSKLSPKFQRRLRDFGMAPDPLETKEKKLNRPI